MNEQKEIADVVLDTPEPDRWVDCGESRPLPMFHMHTLMQYGERCAEAALAWLRSQGEPVVWMYERDGMVHDGMYPPIFLQFQRPLCRDEDWTETPLYLAPRAIENDDREYLSAIAHLGRAMRRLVIAARTSGGTAGPDAELMAACEQAEDAMSVGAIGRAMGDAQPAIPDGYRLVPVEPTPEMIEEAEGVEDLHRRGTPSTWGKVYRAMIAVAPEPSK